MLFSRDWLSVYVDLPESPEAIARRLTFAGFSVEGMTGREGEPADIVF